MEYVKIVMILMLHLVEVHILLHVQLVILLHPVNVQHVLKELKLVKD